MMQTRDYHLWSIAAVRFSCTPDQVTEEQRSVLQADVDRAVAMEVAILGSSEGMGVSVPDNQIEAAVAQWQDVHPDCDLPEATIHAGVRREVSVQTVLDKVAARATPPSVGEAKEFYMANMQSFHQPERRVLRHILVKDDNDEVAGAVLPARTRVERLVQALDAGEDFAELARSYSDCPTASQSGQLQAVPQGALSQEVDALAFSLAEGEWAGPVRSDMGWHLIACDEILAAERPSFDDVSDRILAHLAQQSQRIAQANWLKALTAQSAA